MKIASRNLWILLPATLLALAGCQEKETVKFGVVLPLTGPSSVYGESVKKGVDLAYEHIQQDTMLTYGIEIEVLDSASDAEKAGQLAAQLFEESAAVIGGATSAEALAMIEAANESGKLLMVPSASTEKLSRSGRTIFRLFTTTLQESSVMGTFADDTLNSETVTIVRSEGAPSDGFIQGFTTAFETAGGIISATIDIEPGGNAAAAAEQVVGGHPDAVYLAVEGPLLPELIIALRNAGFGTTEGLQQWILSTSSMSSSALIARAGDAAQDIYITQSVFDLTSEEGAMPAFAAAYREKYGEEPDLYAGHGYDSVLLLAEASKKIINTLPSEFLKGIRSINPLSGASGMALQFNEAGDAQKFPRIHWIDKGGPRDFQKAMAERRKALDDEMKRLQDESRRLRQEALRNN